MRLFIAVELSNGCRSAASKLLASLARSAPEAKWVRDDALHLTLIFLGEREPAHLPALQQLLEKVAAKHPAHRLELKGGGAFGSKRRPRVLWVNVAGQVEPLQALQAELSAALESFDYQPEKRDFRPHLTLARSRDPRGDSKLADLAPSLEHADLGAFEVDRLVLFQSKLSPKGAQYTPIFHAALKPSER